MTSRSPKAEAAAYRIWCYAEPRGWNVSVTEIAEALDESPKRVGSICNHRGWLSRMRRDTPGRAQRQHEFLRARAPVAIDTDLRRELGV